MQDLSAAFKPYSLKFLFRSGSTIVLGCSWHAEATLVSENPINCDTSGEHLENVLSLGHRRCMLRSNCPKRLVCWIKWDPIKL
jgi:hypothetical protein